MIVNASIDVSGYITDAYLKFNRIMTPYIDKNYTEPDSSGVTITEDQSIMYKVTFFLLPEIQEKLNAASISVEEKHFIKEVLNSNGRRCIIMYIPQDPSFNDAREYDYEVLEYCSKFLDAISLLNQTTVAPNGKIYAVDIMDEISRILENKFENGNRNSSYYKDHTITTLYTTEERFDLTKMIFPYTTVMKMTHGVLFIFDYPNEIPTETLNEFGKILFI